MDLDVYLLLIVALLDIDDESKNKPPICNLVSNVAMESNQNGKIFL